MAAKRGATTERCSAPHRDACHDGRTAPTLGPADGARGAGEVRATHRRPRVVEQRMPIEDLDATVVLHPMGSAVVTDPPRLGWLRRVSPLPGGRTLPSAPIRRGARRPASGGYGLIRKRESAGAVKNCERDEANHEPEQSAHHHSSNHQLRGGNMGHDSLPRRVPRRHRDRHGA